MKKLTLLTLRISLMLMPIMALVFAPAAQAQTVRWGGACTGQAMITYVVRTDSALQAANVPNVVDASSVATIQGFQCMISNVLLISLTGISLIGFVMFIVGAFMYMLSGGNAKGTETAKNTITYAVIGLVVALSAFIILNLVANFTGVTSILNFTLPDSSTQL